jgi:hypothetical protein
MKTQFLICFALLFTSVAWSKTKANRCIEFRPESGPIVLPLWNNEEAEFYLSRGTYLSVSDDGWLRLTPLDSQQTRFQVEYISAASCHRKALGVAFWKEERLELEEIRHF